MVLIADTSVTLAWVLPDERAEATEAILDRALTDGLVVPVLWNYEMANGLAQSQRRGRLTQAELDTALALLGSIPTVAIPQDTIDGLVAIASGTGLTGYDAAYLALAERENLPLATLDRRLREAATARGITVLP